MFTFQFNYIDWLPYTVIFTLFCVSAFVLLFTPFIEKLPFISNIPAVAVWNPIIHFVAVLTILLSAFLFGAKHENEVWQDKYKDAQVQLAILKQKEAEVNVKYITKYVDRVEYITKYVDRIVYDAKTAIQPYDAACQLPDTFFLYLNAAAKRIPDSAGKVDETSGSGVKADSGEVKPK